MFKYCAFHGKFIQMVCVWCRSILLALSIRIATKANWISLIKKPTVYCNMFSLHFNREKNAFTDCTQSAGLPAHSENYLFFFFRRNGKRNETYNRKSIVLFQKSFAWWKCWHKWTLAYYRFDDAESVTYVTRPSRPRCPIEQFRSDASLSIGAIEMEPLAMDRESQFGR